MLTALDHVILVARDLERATADYSALLGLAPSWTGDHPGLGTADSIFRLGNTSLEILAPADSGPVADLLRGWLDLHGEGLFGLAFATGDIEACRATLAERGLAPGDVVTEYGRDLGTGAETHWRRLFLPTDRTRGVVMFPIQHDSPPETLPLAAPTHGEAAAAFALDHVVLQTNSGDAAKELLGDHLGLRLALDRDFPDWGVRLMFFRVGGVTVEVAAALMGIDIEAALPAAKADAGEDRLYGMSWRVRSVEAARQRLASIGVDVSEVRRGRRPGTRVFTVRSGTCGVPTLMIEVEDGAR
ncbi:MAG: VOC family protein [Candidatus Binatia bacterium]